MEQMTQDLSLIDVINAVTNNNTNSNSGGVDMLKCRRVMYVINGVGIGAAGTIDGRLQSSANANFNVLANITGTNITQIAANNIMASVEVRSDQVTQQNAGHRYVRLQLTGGGNAVTLTAVGVGGHFPHHPGNLNDLNSSYIGSRIVCNS